MEIRMKRFVAGASALALSATLVGCGSSDESTDVKPKDDGTLSGKVTMWTASLAGEPFDTYFKNLESKFEEMHPDVDVVIQDIPQNEMEQKVLTSLTGGDVPDLVNLNPHFMSNIASQGGLLDLTKEVSDEVQNSYVEGPFNAGKLEDKLYALPWYLTTSVSWYDGAKFEEAGITELPTTSAGLYDVAKAVKDKTGKASYYPVVNDGNTIIEKMVTLANGEAIVQDGKAVFENNKEILDFFAVTQKMYKEGIIPQEAAEGSIKTGQELYMAGNVSLLEGGVTFLGPVESGAPDIYKNSKAGQPLAAIEAPVNVAVMNFAVPAKTKNKEAAVALAEFATNAENQLEFSKTAGTVLPSVKASLEDDYFQNPGDSPKAFGMLEASKSLERAKVLLPPTENNAELRQLTKDIFVKNLQGKVKPEEALKELSAEWTKSFEKSSVKVTF